MATYQYEPNKLVESYRKFKARLTTESSHKQTPSDASIPAASNTFSRRPLVVAAIQLTAVESPTNDVEGFWNRAQEAVIRAANQGATLVLLPELFMGPYFCQSQEACLMNLAEQADNENFILSKFQQIAQEYSIVLPISLFERCNNALYNTVIMINGDGSILGKYRKSHIPDGTGYQEKFYFSPGDTGFKVFSTSIGRVGVGICWDQWFPECAKIMALQGADVLLYPTAIGSEPQDSTINSASHWQRVMQGHAAANVSVVLWSRCMYLSDSLPKRRTHHTFHHLSSFR